MQTRPELYVIDVERIVGGILNEAGDDLRGLDRNLPRRQTPETDRETEEAGERNGHQQTVAVFLRQSYADGTVYMSRFRTLIALTACLCVFDVGCGGRTPITAGIYATINRDTLPVGGPIDVTLQFVVAPKAGELPKDGRVLLRMLFADGEPMASYDHDPEPPTSQWQPGGTIRYTRRIFVRNVPYVGGATLVVGLFSKETGKNVGLSGAEDLGNGTYRAASLTLQAAPSVVTYGDGWYRAEGNAEVANEWRWTAEQATMSMRNPQRDSMLYLRIGGAPSANETPQTVTVENEGRALRRIEVKSPMTDYEVPISAADLGSSPDLKLLLKVDRTFVPAKVSGGNDTRTLGVRVFNAILEPTGKQ